jgi:hypothetical protein
MAQYFISLSKSKSSLKEAFLALEGAARSMVLRIIQEKTKYMITSQNAEQSENITICNYTFEVLQEFTYLGTSVSRNKDISQEIKNILLIANECYYRLKNQL